MPNDWPRPVVYFEIRGTDQQSLKRFYSEMFTWDIGEGPIASVPAGLGAPENGIGGHIRQADSPGVSLFIQVRDLEASMSQAVELGGTITMGRFDIPGGASIAGITDPEGTAITLVQQ